MRYLKYGVFSAALLGVLFFTAGNASAQVAVGVGVGVHAGPVGVAIGAEPVCAYGYYPYAPYGCAPAGYWAPRYFVGGIFVGAGPWFRGWGHPYGWYARPGYGYRPGWGYRPGYYRPGAVYHGPVRPVAHGYVHGGYAHGWR